MTNFRPLLASLLRPRLLMQAARLGLPAYRRERDLRRIARLSARVAPARAADSIPGSAAPAIACSGAAAESLLAAFFRDLDTGKSNLVPRYFAPAGAFVRWTDPKSGMIGGRPDDGTAALDQLRDDRANRSSEVAKLRSDLEHLEASCLTEINLEAATLRSDSELTRIAGDELAGGVGVLREQGGARTPVGEICAVEISSLTFWKCSRCPGSPVGTVTCTACRAPLARSYSSRWAFSRREIAWKMLCGAGT